MESLAVASSARAARSVASAARDLLLAVQDGTDVRDAAEMLEVRARRVVDVTVHGFDAGQAGTALDPADMLAAALSQLEIGNTLLAAQHTLATSGEAVRLSSAVLSLEDAADAMEILAASPPQVHGFDTARASAAPSVRDAALAALDAKSDAAAAVATAVLSKTLKPLTERVPASRPDLGDTPMSSGPNGSLGQEGGSPLRT